MFTTDTVPMMTDFTTIDGSSTSQGEILETEYPPMRSRVGDQEDGLLVEGRKRNYLSSLDEQNINTYIYSKGPISTLS